MWLGKRAKSISNRCAGVVAPGMYTRDAYATREALFVIRDDQPDIREEQAGRIGVAER